MSKYKLTIESFSVSYALDTFIGGEKQSNFMSITMKSNPPIDPEDFAILQLEESLRVSLAVLQAAVCRGSISLEDASARRVAMKANFDNFKEAMLQKKDYEK